MTHTINAPPRTDLNRTVQVMLEAVGRRISSNIVALDDVPATSRVYEMAAAVHRELIQPLEKRIAELEAQQAKLNKIISDGIEETVHRRNWGLAAENAELRFKARGEGRA